MPSDNLTASSAAQTQPARSDAFTLLTPFGWSGGVAVIFIGMLLSFFLAGYFVIYWRNADMDFMIAYTALAMNDGKPQLFIDHPAYITILSVKWWFQILHNINLLDAWKLSAIPSATNVPAFDTAMTSAIRAERIVSLITGFIFVGLYAWLIRHVIRDWRIALFALFAFAFSGGMAVEIRILRSELIAASLFALAFLVLVIVARRATIWRPLIMAVAAAMCVLGLENKVQTVLLISTLPLLMLPFGTPESRSTAFWNNSSRAWGATVLASVIAAGCFVLALPLIRAGIAPETIASQSLRPLFGGPFRFQTILLIWLGLGMIGFALIWRVSVTETLASMFAVIAGSSLALLALYIQYNIGNVAAVINPLEKLLVFADADASSGMSILISGITGVLHRYTFVLYTSPRPSIFLIWFILPGIVVAWRRGERQVALQALFLMGAAFCIDVVGVRRGLKTEYFLFTDPLMILAGALLLERLADLRFAKWAYVAGIFLLVAHGILSQAEAVKHVLKRSGPEYICDWNLTYQPELPMPWCDLPPKRP